MSNESSNKPVESLTLLPHQVELIQQVVNASIPGRYLLSSPPGTGKSAAVAAVAGALRNRNEALRCLVIVPAPLVFMWQGQLRKFGNIDCLVMTPQTYRRLQAETSKEVNVWTQASCVVVSIDFLKVEGRIEEILKATWDLIIIDEIQICSTGSQRGKVAEKIWKDSGVPLVVTATTIPDRPEWLVNDSNKQLIRWNYSTLVQHGTIPQRHFTVIKYSLTDAEKAVSTRLSEVIRTFPNTSQADLLARLLYQCLNSSMYAFEQSLRCLLAAKSYPDRRDDRAESDLEDMNEPAVGETAEIDREAGEQIAGLLEAESTDSKWVRCEQLLRDCGIGERCSGVIFTDFAHTAQYLEILATTRDLKSFLITGSSSLTECQRALEGAKGAPSILIVTSAVEGISLDYTNQVIHYDLPQDSMRLLQRYGRVERVGSPFKEVYHYCLVAQESDADLMLSRLLSDVQNLETAWK